MSKSFISLHDISYRLPNGSKLLGGLNFDIVYGAQTAIVGDNGCGKSTLLKIITGDLKPSSGSVQCQASFFAIPQLPQHSGSVIEAMGLKTSWEALQRIKKGNAELDDFVQVAEKWDLAETIAEIFMAWEISSQITPESNFSELSGGEKEKIMLAAAFLSQADILFFDEPTNNLDCQAKNIFYRNLSETQSGVVVISHDRQLLRQMTQIAEIAEGRIKLYGGNYDFYCAEKQLARQNLEAEISNLRKEKQQLVDQAIALQEKSARKNAYGEKQVANRRYSRMAGHNMALAAQNSIGAKKQNLIQKLNDNQQKSYQVGLALKEELIKIPLPDKPFIKSKAIEIKQLHFSFGDKKLFEDYNLFVSGGERLALCGKNGSGKTTLIKLILGEFIPDKGQINLNVSAVYLNQNLSLLDANKSLLDNMIDLNPEMTINQAYAILANFKFRNEAVLKKAGELSGGELLKACLASILGTSKQPEMLILDEPTNNLDISSQEILETALRQYGGSLLIVSHDEDFLQNIGINRFEYL